MDAGRGLSLLHNGPPTERRPLIPILLFHTSFQSTHTSLTHLPRLQSLTMPPQLWSPADNSEKILSGATVGRLRTHTGAIRGHQDTLSLCIVKQWQHLRDGSKSFLRPGGELLGVTAHQVSVINGSLSCDLRQRVGLIMSRRVRHHLWEPCCSTTPHALAAKAHLALVCCFFQGLMSSSGEIGSNNQLDSVPCQSATYTSRKAAVNRFTTNQPPFPKCLHRLSNILKHLWGVIWEVQRERHANIFLLPKENILRRGKKKSSS